MLRKLTLPLLFALILTFAALRPKVVLALAEEIVYITRTGQKYNRNNLSDAKGRGYEPCPRCGPPE